MGRGGVSPTHFFYEMTFGEAAAYLRGMERRDRAEWERLKVLMNGFGGDLNLPWMTETRGEVDEAAAKDLRNRIKKVEL